MVSTLKVNKIQIPNSDSDVMSFDASTGNVTIPKNVTFSGTVAGASPVSVISDSTTAVTGASSIEIDLDTSGIYRYQELHMHQAYHHTGGGANLCITKRDEDNGS